MRNRSFMNNDHKLLNSDLIISNRVHKTESYQSFTYYLCKTRLYCVDGRNLPLCVLSEVMMMSMMKSFLPELVASTKLFITFNVS